MSLVQVLNALGAFEDDSHGLSPRTYLRDGVTMDIDPLPSTQRKGLIAVSVMAILSFLATLALISFITYRLVFWRGSYARYIGYNQYIILIYNLVLADLQQSLAFLICLKWISENKISADTAGCFLQGLWLQIGDPSSGLFVLAIAIHTFLLVALGYKLSHRVFVASVVGIWVFVAILVIIPLASHGRYVFIPSGAWCWISEDYEAMRLWTHYIWIFLAEFGTVCLYAIMWFQLRRRIKQSAILGNSHIESLKRLRRVIGYMVIYPIAYIVLSLPLAAGRMATAQGDAPNVAYFCVAGAMITSSGLVDALLYTLTRKNLILESEPSHDNSYKFASSKNRKTDNNHLTTITADPKYNRTDVSALRMARHEEEDLERTVRDGSTDNIVQPSGVELSTLGKVYQYTTIEITSEPAFPVEGEASDQSSKGSFDGSPDRGNGQAARMWGR
ncbi:hypothetical protein ASPACDRAFT_74796 [Aspergillus aculeatus ATCC 16872]|uniref:G protein-coupled receptor GPR1/2/3 C-terminal domain-containing protein n=1 Tax=Aspergillus aculeatus (strain ATCC 16872 / CBS 172.66 / WB 5094) TaxID=690307 RepID=A0A1L9XAD0_ASPA1|nr:uncharacterized protein ASPACDRAFT_74796 [Aspergillus aculeatus ATCC 16872]OJK05289.1 hypothetical protein ASPACDRAFT_74796 [Aspergillus aculeatus ATCC 16872]